MKTRAITDKLHDFQKRATDTVRQVGETTDACVRDNIWSALACAALVGCVVGYCLVSPRHKS